MDRYVVYPGYELYSYIYLCKPIIQPLIAAVYCALALWRLLSYYRVINNGVKVVEPPKMWITLLMGTLVNIIAINILTLILPKMAAMTSSIAFALMMVFIVLYFILGYKVVRLKFLLYVIDLHDKTTPRIPKITKLKPKVYLLSDSYLLRTRSFSELQHILFDVGTKANYEIPQDYW